ncbi:non-ribosomal peptide synthetase [Umezawaea beigongshangensis]|uniref:non-ribosomal peptide synthetase n=1 Tax=Umezawaea beigongshangensis TaxID=2780383 RepID=UPI0018F1AE53|nr:non-ribosomal peptide synthetase [Umezawaea beigongshangensis]
MSTTPAHPTTAGDELTAAVTVAVADALDLSPDELDPEVPLVELGLESFTAVRLRRRLREDTGVGLALTDFLGGATARTVAEALAAADPARGAAVDETAAADAVADDGTFPLTPVQIAYWVGRDPSFPLGGVATFFYREFEHDTAEDPDAEVARLTAAWNLLVRRHPALRTVVDGDARGRVLEEVPELVLPVTDLRHLPPAAAVDEAERLRHGWSHQVRPADRWPLYDLRVVLLPTGRTRVCVGTDVLALDLAGWVQVISEWGALVADPVAELPPPASTFAAFARRRTAPAAVAALDLPPGPALPLATDPRELRSHRFTRTATELTPRRWAELRRRAARHGLSPTGVLLAACSLTLARWGATDEFCLTATLFDRPDEAELAHVVGDFTSTVPVRVPRWEPLRGEGFAAWAGSVNTSFWSAMDGRDSALVSGAAALEAPRHPVVFTSGLGLTPDGRDPAGWLGREVFGISQTPQVLLDHIVLEEGGRLRICWDAVDTAYPDGLVAGMARAHALLLERLADSDAAWEDPSLGWVPSFEPDAELNATPFGEAGPLLDDPLRAAARDAGERPALLDARGVTSHEELAAVARALGARLAGAGVGPGDLVAVSAPKGREQVAALLGVSASGAGYVPVEPSWPAERVASVCEQAGVRHAVVAAGAAPAWPEGVRVHEATTSDPAGPATTADPVGEPRRPVPGDLAYAIFTSGSTGRPKGVAVEHRAARTTIDDLVDRFPIGPRDRVLALSAFSFDLSVHDVFGVLGAGGALVLPDADRQRDPGHWLELAERHGVTLWNTAPALLEMLVEYAEIDPDLAARALRPLRLVFLSGDWIPVTLPDRLRALAPSATVVSLGGATEAAIWSICHVVEDVDPAWSSIPYGRALRGQSFHVLDEHGAPCPVGEPGELHIGGDGLARGYAGDPAQTAQRFVHHPVLGRRLYRTGDLGRWRHDGEIEFLGRVDRQVKIRGHRIELGEVESVLDRVPSVRKSVALAVPGPDDRPRLVAHVVPAGSAESVVEADLVAHLRQRVPDYMVPSRFCVHPEFPVTPNGKVDYAALPNPYRRGTAHAEVVAEAPPAADPVVDGSWWENAVARAAALGLEVSLGVAPGALAPADALESAARWSRETRREARARGAALEERFAPDGLVRLVAAPGAVPVPAPLPESAPVPVAPVADPEVERVVAEVFSELLGCAVDAEAPFFSLGATSLTLVLATRRLVDRGWSRLAVVDLFAHPSARALAAFLTGVATPAAPPPPVPSAAPVGRRAARLLAQEVAR